MNENGGDSGNGFGQATTEGVTKLNAKIDNGTASEAKNPAVRLGFSVSEGRDFFGPRTGKRKCVSWRFLADIDGKSRSDSSRWWLA